MMLRPFDTRSVYKGRVKVIIARRVQLGEKTGIACPGNHIFPSPKCGKELITEGEIISGTNGKRIIVCCPDPRCGFRGTIWA